MPDAISDQFSNIRNMFQMPNPSPMTGSNQEGGMSTAARAGLFAGLGPFSLLLGGSHDAANPKVGSMSTEPITGDSLTQFMRSLTNYGAVRGETLGQTGDQILGTGMATTGKGLSLFDQPVNYWQSLLSGNPDEMTRAMAPESSQIAQQYRTAQTNAETNMPMGGYRAGTVANMPFAQAGAVGNTALSLRPQAAAQLSNIGNQIAGIGSDTSKLGLGEQGLGESTIGQTLQALLQRRGQNYNVDTSNRQMLTQGLEELLRALV